MACTGGKAGPLGAPDPLVCAHGTATCVGWGFDPHDVCHADRQPRHAARFSVRGSRSRSVPGVSSEALLGEREPERERVPVPFRSRYIFWERETL